MSPAAPRLRLPARIRFLDLDELSTGFGLLAAAGLLALPLALGEPAFAPDVEVLGLPLAILLAAAAAIVAIAAIADLLGRSELRQGVAVLGLAGLLAGGTLLFVSVGALLDERGSAELDAAVPFAIVAVWGSALVVGTTAFGPTRTAVLVGLLTIAIALLVPVGPDSEPFLGFALDSAWSYVLIPAGAAALVAVWRLLDLPRLGGIVLGGGLAVFSQVWLQGAPSVGVACPSGVPDCVPPSDIQTLIWAGCLFIAFGALFGRPSNDR